MEFNFFKYQGTGNDFIIIDDRKHIFPFKSIQTIKKLCDRKFGIGADGLMLIRKSTVANFKMLYANADGNSSTMCGNGGRCIAHLAASLQIGKFNTLSFEAIDGIHWATIHKNKVKLQMQSVSSIKKINSTSFELNTGSPHYVKLSNHAFDDTLFLKSALKIRNSQTYKSAGINVNFMYQVNKNDIHIRTFERGVEAETLSCGTGAVASALVNGYRFNLNKFKMKVFTPGGLLEVFAQSSSHGAFDNIYLLGPAVCTYTGTFHI